MKEADLFRAYGFDTPPQDPALNRCRNYPSCQGYVVANTYESAKQKIGMPRVLCDSCHRARKKKT